MKELQRLKRQGLQASQGARSITEHTRHHIHVNWSPNPAATSGAVTRGAAEPGGEIAHSV